MALILYIFNIGYLFQHLGSILQIRRIERKRDIEGVCLDSQILFFFGAIARMIWITDTLLKEMWLTYFELFLAFVTLIYTMYLCLFKFNGVLTLLQSINNSTLPIVFRWYVILTVSLILSYFFFPGNEGQPWDIQMFVSLNIFTEAAGLLPQIYYVNRQKDSNIFSSLYLMCLCVSRILRLFFWIKMYQDDNSFGFLLFADVVHLLMVSGFIYSFLTNLDKLMLPTQHRDEGKKIF